MARPQPYPQCTYPRAAVTREEIAAVDGKADRLPNTELISWNHNSYLLVQVSLHGGSHLFRLPTPA